MPARATVNAAFYGGPLWKEHSATMNDRLIDHTNVLLLRPLTPEAGVLVTLDAPNNFPRLPFRTDGSYLVWLGS